MIRLKDLLLEYDVETDAELKLAKQIVRGLLNRGFSYTGAVALAGNIAHESGCVPDITEKSGTGGYGLMQWDPGYKRRQALTAFAKHTKTSESSLATQLDFMKCELRNGYIWFGKPVPGIDKSLVYYKQEDGTYSGLSKEYVKKYNKSIVDANIETSTANLMDNVFNPVPGSKQQRIDNALKIHEFINGTQTSTSSTTDTKKLSVTDFTMYPNPADPNAPVSITIDKDKLPIQSIDLDILSVAGKSYGKHHWDDIQEGILKFNAPPDKGTYIIRLSNDVVLKLMVQ
jgi:hypothetical protein